MKNVLAIFLDSCRYDTFMMAEKKNIESLDTEIHKAYSPAAWTVPSMVAYTFGTPPMNIPNEYRSSLFLHKEGEDIRKIFRFTHFLTPNPYVLKLRRTVFSAFDDMRGIQYDYVFSCNTIFNDILRIIKEEENFIVFVLLMETHDPYWDGVRKHSFLSIQTKEEFMKIQSKAVEVVDKYIGKLLNNIPEKTRLIISSDHGELFEDVDGKRLMHHNLTRSYIEFHPKLFEIPFLVKDFK